MNQRLDPSYQSTVKREQDWVLILVVLTTDLMTLSKSHVSSESLFLHIHTHTHVHAHTFVNRLI